MAKAHENPFPVDCFQSTEMELPETTSLLDLPEDRLNALLSLSVALGVSL